MGSDQEGERQGQELGGFAQYEWLPTLGITVRAMRGVSGGRSGRRRGGRGYRAGELVAIRRREC